MFLFSVKKFIVLWYFESHSSEWKKQEHKSCRFKSTKNVQVFRNYYLGVSMRTKR